MFEFYRKLLMRIEVDGPVFDGCTGGIVRQAVATFPIGGGSNRPWTKTAAAIRAHISKDVLHAGPAEGALECTDHCLRRIRWQRPVAVFTSGS